MLDWSGKCLEHVVFFASLASADKGSLSDALPVEQNALQPKRDSKRNPQENILQTLIRVMWLVVHMHLSEFHLPCKGKWSRVAGINKDATCTYVVTINT